MALQTLTFFLSTIIPLTTARQEPQIPLQLPPSLTPKFPWIHAFASIGDSYSAGLGSGSRLDWCCSRYTSSHPHILHNSLLGDDSARTHQFLACSGASTDMIRNDQLPKLEDGTVDLLTVSAGGNDVGLSPVLSSCVYQFWMGGEGECENAVLEARNSIEDPGILYKNVLDLLDAAQKKMSPQGVIVVTGYARFFGTEDDICDEVSWAVWKNIEFKKQYLKVSMRKALNSLVHSVNDVFRNVTEAAGPRVLFVDYDSQVEAARGRYCEAGIREPAPNRNGLVFYEWDTVDTGENSTQLQQYTGGDVPAGSFEADIAERINKTLTEHPEWKFDPEKGFIDRSAVGEKGIVGDIGDKVRWMLPDSWKRVFHLRPEGHEIVARAVVERLEGWKAEEYNLVSEKELKEIKEKARVT